jgi:hypothetical protein
MYINKIKMNLSNFLLDFYIMMNLSNFFIDFYISSDKNFLITY